MVGAVVGILMAVLVIVIVLVVAFFVYRCVCVCVCVVVCVCVCVCCVCVCVVVCVCVLCVWCMVCVCVMCVHVHVCVHVRVCVYVHVCVYGVCVHACTTKCLVSVYNHSVVTNTYLSFPRSRRRGGVTIKTKEMYELTEKGKPQETASLRPLVKEKPEVDEEKNEKEAVEEQPQPIPVPSIEGQLYGFAIRAMSCCKLIV